MQRISVHPILIVVILLVPEVGLSADWAPDGRQLLFWADWNGNLEAYRIIVEDSGLLNLSQHAAEDANPVWSPDGSRIAFYSKRDGNGEVYLMEADGSKVTNVTNSASAEFNPGWSPDGSMLVFQSYSSGHGQIHTIHIDGILQCE